MLLFGTQRINEKGHLEVGGCDTVELADRFGTPLYVMDEAAIRARCAEYRTAFAKRAEGAKVVYAAKAFLSKYMARLVYEAGLAVDVASLGELLTVAAAGVPLETVTLHGNYKKDEDLTAALDLSVGRVCIDSVDEAHRLSELAAARRKKQPSLLRVAPGIDAHTLDAISTGRNDTKFGVTVENGAALEAIRKCLALPGIELKGLHAHIGSQILTLEPFVLLARKMAAFVEEVRSATGWIPSELVLGGGLGIHYSEEDHPPAVEDLAQVLTSTLQAELERRDLPLPALAVEPGRSVVGEFGLTLYRVGPIKTVPAGNGATRTYVSVDGGLSDNPRPIMYGSTYPVLLANRASEPADFAVRICGRHCETDTLFDAVSLPRPRPGDLVAVLSTGAYNHTMASNYNFFYRPPVVFVKDGEARLSVRRETQEDLLARDLG